MTRDTTKDILKIVIMAVGGQGGGVLTNWIESAARAAGRAVQATSVAGVAQRTGATIYYIEIAPKGVEDAVFSLAPAAGDVDVLIAAEWMEAGRAIQRGFVTPDRTTLIASTHRALAVSEKVVPGDGVAAASEVQAAARVAAERLIMADYEALAIASGSVISASLLGALAASGTLPLSRETFEDAIRASGRGVDRSLAAFALGFAGQSEAQQDTAPHQEDTPAAHVPGKLTSDWTDLSARIKALPQPAQPLATAGLHKVVDFQDMRLGQAYLDRVTQFAHQDSGADNFALTQAAAKYIANALAYDDVIHVADRKTRAARTARIDTEMSRTAAQALQVTEYFHPRAEEIAGLLPVRFGQWVEMHPARMRWLDRWFGAGRRIRSDRLGGFLLLWLIAGLRWWRPHTLRQSVEDAHLNRWLSRVRAALDHNPDLAIELLRCRRLIKGYSDTHARGLSKFDQVMDGAELVLERPDAADWVRRLRDAALQDAEGQALTGALATVRSF